VDYFAQSVKKTCVLARDQIRANVQALNRKGIRILGSVNSMVIAEEGIGPVAEASDRGNAAGHRGPADLGE
jgi:hypothetical protein